jgi:Leucine-rich repeat (LRR) protein
MSSNFLMGTLPQGESFASMTGKYWLSYNSCSKPDSNEGLSFVYFSIVDLQELRLPYNQFSGSVPPMIGALTNLHFLDMSNNAFDEPLPTDIGNLSALEVLLFHATYTEGPLPSEIGQLENLRALNGKGCIRLGGSIPSEFGRLSRLGKKTTPQLVRCTHYMKGSYTYKSLLLICLVEYFDLDLTEITGTIPSEIGGMENVGYFGLRSTQVAGTIPSEIGKLEKLFELDLSYTDLTGSLPSELGLLTNLGTFLM